MGDTKGNLGFLGAAHLAGRENEVAIINVLADGSISETSRGDFHDRCDRAAQLYVCAGLRAGDRLAIAIGNLTEFLIAAFGALRAGIVVVPLNIKFAPDTLRFILHDAVCKAVVADTRLQQPLVGLLRCIAGPRRTIAQVERGWLAFGEMLAQLSPNFVPPALAEQHPAMITYTAGSTGVPKGVLLTHGGQVWLADTIKQLWPRVMTREARAMVAVPLFQKNALAVAVKPMLHSGGSMVIMQEFRPRAVLQAIARFGCTYSTGVPAMYAMMLREQDLIGSIDLTRYQTVIIGSAPCPPRLLRSIEAQLSVDVAQGYGMTECAPVLVAQRRTPACADR
jgi:acyl-CoA synthetase (AMP-forming)/AMP-acid ligase II